MNKIVSGILATTLSVSFAAAAGPANAAQMFAPQAPEASSNVLNIEARNGDYQWKKRHGERRNFSRNFNGKRNFARNNDRGVYWNGHRGYREYHRGYRRHGDNWFPLAAFATGALITGAIINNENNRVYEGNSHVQWCYDHYRSYRSSDNTFQPNYGPRKECRSPY
ncbi:BA14K family protein [Mesorhizobium sp. M0088]|uniref:BA14K family protein n=1 Tax=Mesorhizobium sp. M0088 TaxID=2956873 RepID=UPI00333DD83C